MLYSSVFQVHFFFQNCNIYIYIFFIFIFHDVGLIMIVEEKKQSKYSCVLNNSSKFGGMISM